MATRGTCWDTSEPGVAWLHNGQLYQYQDTKDELVARLGFRAVEPPEIFREIHRMMDVEWQEGFIETPLAQD